jgi:hypothetical protein
MLKYKLDSVDELDDGVKALYEEKDGTFFLKVEGIPEPDNSGLKNKVDELLKEKKDAAKRAKDAEESAARKSGDIEALEKSWSEKLSTIEEDYKSQLNEAKSAINSMTVEATASSLANELAISGSSSLLIPIIKSRLTVEKRGDSYGTMILDKDGKPSAATLNDLREEIKAMPECAPIIVSSKASGGGAAGSSNSGGATVTKATRSQFEEYSPSQRMEFVKSGGKITE